MDSKQPSRARRTAVDKSHSENPHCKTRPDVRIALGPRITLRKSGLLRGMWTGRRLSTFLFSGDLQRQKFAAAQHIDRAKAVSFVRVKFPVRLHTQYSKVFAVPDLAVDEPSQRAHDGQFDLHGAQQLQPRTQVQVNACSIFGPMDVTLPERSVEGKRWYRVLLATSDVRRSGVAGRGTGYAAASPASGQALAYALR